MNRNILAAVGALGVMLGGRAVAVPKTLTLEALSSPPAYVTGSDVVVRLRAQGSLDPAAIHFTLNGHAVSPQATSLEDNDLVTTIPGLKPGANLVEARAENAGAARLHLFAHPAKGPVFALPRLPLLACATEGSGLGKAQDTDCSAPSRVDYFYRTTAGAFRPLANPLEHPQDLATATTANGKFPYIVRVDSGVIDRGVYRIAVLDDGTHAEGPWRPGPAWNRRLVIFYGGGCGTHYSQGGDHIDQALSDAELSKGFAYAVSTNLVNQQFCAPLVQAETTMMLKEHVVKTFGPLAWTLGSGASGGSIQQLLIAEMFPGLLNGIQPGMSFPDSQLQEPFDCTILNTAFAADPARWTNDKRAAVSGVTLSTCHDWVATFSSTWVVSPRAPDPADALGRVVSTAGGVLLDDLKPCGLPDAAKLYDARRNPTGLRCSSYDFQVGQLGRDANGHARRPFDNTGVEYGLGALRDKRITFDDFLALNTAAGGFDGDGASIPARSVGDAIGIRNAYATGLSNSGGGLARVPIITQRAYVDTAPPGLAASIHDRMQDFVIRARLARANGFADNQVIWVTSPIGAVNLRALSLDLATRWLDALAADPAPASYQKVVRLKPRDAVDACWTMQGERINEPADPKVANRCNGLYPVHSEPRMVAGEPIGNDIFKCRLTAPQRSAYGSEVSDDQWRRLKQIFSKGVCDYRANDPHRVPFTNPLGLETADVGNTLRN